jgi:SET family sugar efflux transporter-like MFS transporter
LLVDSSPGAEEKKRGMSWLILPPLLAVILMRGGDSTRSIYMPLVVLQLFNDPVIATTMFSITAFAELFFMGYIAYIATRIGEKKTIMMGTAVGALYFVLMANTTSLFYLYLLQVLYAIFVATLLGVAMAYTQSLIKERAGFAASLYMNAIQLGSALGYVSPLLIKGINQKVFYISAILCLIVVLVLSIQRRKENSNEKIGMGC